MAKPDVGQWKADALLPGEMAEARRRVIVQHWTGLWRMNQGLVSAGELPHCELIAVALAVLGTGKKRGTNELCFFSFARLTIYS